MPSYIAKILSNPAVIGHFQPTSGWARSVPRRANSERTTIRP